jgi:hypothetical protein
LLIVSLAERLQIIKNSQPSREKADHVIDFNIFRDWAPMIEALLPIAPVDSQPRYDE